MAAELKIPTPFGHLAAKSWGPANGRPVLALHGWLDNAASFDTLIPLLSPGLHVVALDFSGHGLSSPRPPGCHYNHLEFLIDIKRAVDYLKWTKFTLMGHSLGSQVGLLFTGFYSRYVECFIGLDNTVPLIIVDDYIPSLTVHSINEILKAEGKQGEPRVYTEDELLDRMEEANPGVLTETSKRVLMSRGARYDAVKKGYLLNRDIRAKTFRTYNLSVSTQKNILSRYNGDMLMIRAKDNLALHNYRYLEEEYLDVYRKSCRKFKYVDVEGLHFVHLNNPERVAPFINDFLEQKEGKSKL